MLRDCREKVCSIVHINPNDECLTCWHFNVVKLFQTNPLKKRLQAPLSTDHLQTISNSLATIFKSSTTRGEYKDK